MPTSDALILILPESNVVPPITILLVFFAIGRLSPVSMDSSSVQSPQIIVPSVGIISPLLIIKMSPFIISSNFISTILSSNTFFAIVFLILDKSFNAVVVCLTDLCSKTLPNKTKVIIVALVSKNI